jgi:hypothetical protein
MLAKLASVPSFPSTVGDFFPYAYVYASAPL